MAPAQLTASVVSAFNAVMAGIVSYGSYVPYRRLKRSAIAAVLGKPSGKGERAIASFDEDSVSMAVEATRDALKAAPPGDVQALIFATTTPPYAEKLRAAVSGAAAMLPAEIRSSDMTGSVRAGMSALLQGADAIAGGAKRALVAIGDCRLAAPEGKAEQTTGDGAVAFVLGAENVIAEIEASSSLTREFLDTWRANGERFAHSWEERFTLTQAHAPLLGTVIKNVLEKAKVAPTDLSKVVLDAPNARAADEIARALKIDPAKFSDSFALTIGQTGAAHAGLMLSAALPSAKPGDRLLVATVADGTDAILYPVTPSTSSSTPAHSACRTS